MLKLLRLTFSIALLLTPIHAVAFDRHDSLFGVVQRGGGGNKHTIVPEEVPVVRVTDFENAQKAIFHAAETVEQTVQHAVEEEVHLMFPDLDHPHKEQVASQAQKAVSQGAHRVKQKVKEHDHAEKKIPFEQDDNALHRTEQRILHAIEAAESAVLHAVQEEVESIFHELEHHEDENIAKQAKQSTKHAKKAVEKGVKKAKKKVQEQSEKRRGDDDFSYIQEYIDASCLE